jgi:hypothetical protein
LGEQGSPESWDWYWDLVGKSKRGLPLDDPKPSSSAADPLGTDAGPSISEVLLAFKDHADGYYTKNGKPTAEVDCFTSAMRPVQEMFGLMPAKAFRPSHLKAVRERYIANGWSRGFCNKSTNRIRHIFKWGAAESLVPVETWQGLQALTPLKAGKCDAPDHPKRESVSEDRIAGMTSATNRNSQTFRNQRGGRP